jgi:hypothetical protein
MKIACVLSTVLACCSIAVQRSYGEAEGQFLILPVGWRCPAGWRVDDWVKHPFLDASLTSDTKVTRAVLITNGKI